MFVLGTVVALIGFAGLGLGLFLLVFRKGRRLGGFWLTIGSMLLMSFAGGLVSRSDQSQMASLSGAGPTVIAAPVDAENVVAESAHNEPTALTPELAALATPAALEAYCLSLGEFDAALKEADKRFGIEYSGERELWLNARDEEIASKVTDAVSLPHATWSSHANEHGWMHRCDAMARNWAQVALADLGLSTSDDGRRVSEAIEREYTARFLANSTDGPLFELNRYSRATCKSDVVEGYRFVGCKMIGDRLTSGPLFYLVANLGGEPIIVPFDSATTAHMLKPRYPDKDSVALRVGKYVGPYPLPEVNFANVEAFFE